MTVIKKFKRSYLGIDIGSKNIKLASTPDDIHKYKYSTIKTPPGSCINGYIKDIPTMADAINNCLNGESKLSVKNVVFSILSSDIIIRDMIIPAVPAKELPRLVNNIAEEYIPTSLDEFVTDFKPLEIVNNGGMQKQRILLAAAPRSLINGYLELADKMSINLSAIDVYQNCIIKAAGCLDKSEYVDYLILDVGGQRSTATFFEGGVFAFSRILDLGGDDITRMISGEENIPMNEAEKLKKESACPNLVINSSQLFEDFKNALERCVDYYVTRYNPHGLQKVLLIGGGASFLPLQSYISECLNLMAVTADSFLPHGCGMVFNALGASMREGKL